MIHYRNKPNLASFIHIYLHIYAFKAKNLKQLENNLSILGTLISNDSETPQRPEEYAFKCSIKKTSYNKQRLFPNKKFTGSPKKANDTVYQLLHLDCGNTTGQKCHLPYLPPGTCTNCAHFWIDCCAMYHQCKVNFPKIFLCRIDSAKGPLLCDSTEDKCFTFLTTETNYCFCNEPCKSHRTK